MSLINTLRMYAEDMHSATGYNERSSAMSKAADMIEKFENMSASEACATIPSVMEYVKQLEQERDELKEKVARLSALLEAEPFRNERIEQLEQERDELANDRLWRERGTTLTNCVNYNSIAFAVAGGMVATVRPGHERLTEPSRTPPAAGSASSPRGAWRASRWRTCSASASSSAGCSG